MQKFLYSILIALVCAPFVIGTSAADDRGGFDRHDEHRGFEGHGDIHRFHEHDFERWRGGHWVHDRHAGRFGWWWVVAGMWYFYPTPVYPYPDPYEPPIAVAPPSEAPQYWYYCSNPSGYYPYVPECAMPWQRVPARPQPVAPAPAVITPPPEAPQYWYYCSNPPGYYPQVPQCSTAWQKVPANPPPAAPVSPPVAPPSNPPPGTPPPPN